MKRFLFGMSVVASLAGAAFGQVTERELTATLMFSYPIGDAGRPQTRGVTPGAIYSNNTTFTQAALSQGAVTEGANAISPIFMDDITFDPGAVANSEISRLEFCVANLNPAGGPAVSVRPRLRWWFDNGNFGGPGTYYNNSNGGGNAGFSFNPISFNANSINCFFTTFTPGAVGNLRVPATGRFWAGMQFDNNNGTSGATLAQVANFGQAMFDPVDVGFSDPNQYWDGTGGGSSFGVNAPPFGPLPGVIGDLNFPLGPPANFGWAYVPEPATMALLGLGLAAYARRRR